MYLSKEMTFFDVGIAWRNNIEGRHCRRAYKSEKMYHIKYVPWAVTNNTRKHIVSDVI